MKLGTSESSQKMNIDFPSMWDGSFFFLTTAELSFFAGDFSRAFTMVPSPYSSGVHSN